jgi:putative ABC transport system permease protein
MLKNYLKLGFRHLFKNRLSSIINISGLALAVGCCLVVFVFLDWSMNQDDFHKNRDRIYVVERVASKEGNEQLWGNSPAPMGPMLKTDFPQIENICRLNFVDCIIRQNDNVFREQVSFNDNSFYDMFDFPLKWGNRQNINQDDGIVLTEELSEKLFGKENSLGKNLQLKFTIDGKEIAENFTVKAVFEKRPHESSFYFSALIPSTKMASLGINTTDDWSKTVDMTFIETASPHVALPGENQTKKYTALFNAANKDAKIAGYHFQPLKTMNFHSYKVMNSRFNSTHIIGLIMLLSIAVSILLLVCSNYMNIAVASAAGRIREIGVRKVMGSSRKQIIIQFLLENGILCAAGVALGLVLAKMFFLPWFAAIAGIDLTEKLFSNTRLWIALVALVGITVILGAVYPSFYISSLKPVSIVQGKMILGSKNRFRKILLGIQFFVTFLGISMAIAFVQQNKIARAKPWGYEPAGNVVVSLDASAGFNLFKTALGGNNKVTGVTGSVQALGRWTRQMVIKAEGRDETVQGLEALPHFASQMGISIMKGRDLSDSFRTDETTNILVNQAFLKKMNWASGVGRTIDYENNKYSIVGETNDFRFEPFSHKVGPMIILGCKPAAVKFVYAKASEGMFSNAHAAVQATWKKTFPDLPFDYYYQDGVFENYLSGFSQVAKVMTATSFIMVMVSISGIFGLALLILSRKMKEISVRKVLGAGPRHIGFQVIKEFLFAIGIAFLVGFPVSYLLIKSIYTQVSPESSVSFGPLIITFAGLIGMTLISVAWHLFKAYTANPVLYLKDE